MQQFKNESQGGNNSARQLEQFNKNKIIKHKINNQAIWKPRTN